MSDAYKIAKDVLKSNYSEKGILAGHDNYEQYWLRDGVYASFGSVEIGDFDVTKSMLSNLAECELDGRIPMRIRGENPGWMVWDHLFDARYHTDKPPFSYAMDSNSLFVIALDNYVTESGDVEFLKDNFDVAARAVSHLESLQVDGLLFQETYGDWADTLTKRGFVAYSNVCYYKALEAMKKMSNKLGIDSDYESKSEDLKDRIIKKFWNGKFLEDFPGGNFDSAANTMACLWMFDDDDREKVNSIFEITENLRKDSVPLPTIHPPYDVSRSSLDSIIAGNSGFHNGDSWLWIGCFDALAKDKFGLHDQAKEELETISKIIEKYDNVYEVYHDGTPNRTEGISDLPLYPFSGYDADSGWSWSAGMFVWAYKKIID